MAIFQIFTLRTLSFSSRWEIRKLCTKKKKTKKKERHYHINQHEAFGNGAKTEKNYIYEINWRMKTLMVCRVLPIKEFSLKRYSIGQKLNELNAGVCDTQIMHTLTPKNKQNQRKIKFYFFFLFILIKIRSICWP